MRGDTQPLIALIRPLRGAGSAAGSTPTPPRDRTLAATNTATHPLATLPFFPSRPSGCCPRPRAHTARTHLRTAQPRNAGPGASPRDADRVTDRSQSPEGLEGKKGSPATACAGAEEASPHRPSAGDARSLRRRAVSRRGRLVAPSPVQTLRLPQWSGRAAAKSRGSQSASLRSSLPPPGRLHRARVGRAQISLRPSVSQRRACWLQALQHPTAPTDRAASPAPAPSSHPRLATARGSSRTP
jgi:hypothetical protein